MSDTRRDVVVVTGDVTIDWNLSRPSHARGAAAEWNPDECTRACWQRGGAALLGDLVEAVAAGLGGPERELVVRQTAAPHEPVWPGDDRFNHSYAMWSVFPYASWPPADKDRPAWRVAEYLGFDRCPDREAGQDWNRVEDDVPDPTLVVLDDGNLGFRDRPDLWPAAVNDGAPPWIVLKMSRPVAEGPLWQRLHEAHAERLVVVLTVDDLRRTEVKISRQLSWERSAQDLTWELIHNPTVNALSACAHTVVSFGAAGALLLSRHEDGGPPASTLVFDPRVVEGSWESDHPGGMIGGKTTLTAGIVRELLAAPRSPDMLRGIRAGLAARRALHLEGYAERGTPPADVHLAFPVELVTKGLELAEDGPFAAARVPDPGAVAAQDAPGRLVEADPARGAPSHGVSWTILQDRYQGDLLGLAARIVPQGPTAVLRDVPIGQFGALLTVDRQEIEAYRSIGALVEEYAKSVQTRPLSIAVFGPPGSGKSFGVTQVATAMLPGVMDKPLEFNLSQFAAPEDLTGALHQVRDAVLKGKLPLVFWDEFDTALGGRSLGWLRYFLAPMQDGTFQEGQITHPIGRCIFVFAGGTAERMNRFGHDLDEDEFRAVKGPDFASRLRGYVNVLGPNPRQDGEQDAPSGDPHFVIRRAILLHSMLKRGAPQLFHPSEGGQRLAIDAGVLRAFLEIGTYRHGARSMEAVISMSRLAGRTEFERSSLPARAQLDLHVDGQEFLALVQRPDLSGDLLERLASVAHDLYREELRLQGFEFGPEFVEGRASPLLVPYAELSDEDKDKNRRNVRDIPSKLGMLGYVMIPARGDEPPFAFAPDEVDELAVVEHERFVGDMLERGWKVGPETDKARRVNATLIPWAELAEPQREKDRTLVRGIPAILARAGYTIARIG